MLQTITQENAEALILRPANLGDLERLRRWRNDPWTRACSHHSGEVDVETHQRWLAAVLISPQRRLWIAEEAGLAVGCVREDESEGVIELSWTVAPEARGRGLAQRMVGMIVARCDSALRAEIKVEHAASRRIAEAVGLRLVGEREGICHYERTSRGAS